MNDILKEIQEERAAQDKKWGEQNHANGTSSHCYGTSAEIAKMATDEAAGRKSLYWTHILKEEVYEAFAEEDVDKLRTELIQTAAVAVAWIECIDRKKLEVKEEDKKEEEVD